MWWIVLKNTLFVIFHSIDFANFQTNGFVNRVHKFDVYGILIIIVFIWLSFHGKFVKELIWWVFTSLSTIV